MRLSLRLASALLSACALLGASPAFAQATPGTQGIEQRMTPEQFKAAGLDKLSPAELASLNGWLYKTIDTETAKAAVQAKKKVESENRGFFNFGTTEPVISTLAGKFDGFGRGRKYTLGNGQVWMQVDDASLVGVHLSDPAVRITPSLVGNAWYMAVGNYGTRAKVQRVK